MFCTECGGKLSTDSIFCNNCGKKIEISIDETKSLKVKDPNEIKNIITEKYKSEIENIKKLKLKSTGKFITFFGLLDEGALKNKARQEREFLRTFNPTHTPTTQEGESLNLMISLASQINTAIDEGSLKGDFWSTNPINIDTLSLSIKNNYINKEMIDFKIINEINSWLKSTLDAVDEIKLINKSLTLSTRTYQEEIKTISEQYKTFINDETISKTERSERFWEIISNTILKSFNQHTQTNNLDFIVKALQDSSLGETLEKFTKEAFNSNPSFTYSVFRNNLYDKLTIAENMMLIKEEKLNEFLDYLNSYYSNVLMFIEGNKLRDSHCDLTAENSEAADKDRLKSIAAIIFIAIIVLFILVDPNKLIANTIIWGAVLTGISFYFINKLNTYKCTDCGFYKSLVLAKKDFQGSYSYSYNATERDRLTNAKGDTTGHIERQVKKTKTVNKYAIATYCLSCNSIHYDDIEEE